MITIEQYRPAYFTGFEDEHIQVNSFEELMNIEWIKNWGTHPDFYRYSISPNELPNKKPQTCIMAELKEGTEWWVIAICRDADFSLLSDNLPLWKPKKYDMV